MSRCVSLLSPCREAQRVTCQNVGAIQVSRVSTEVLSTRTVSCVLGIRGVLDAGIDACDEYLTVQHMLLWAERVLSLSERRSTHQPSMERPTCCVQTCGSRCGYDLMCNCDVTAVHAATCVFVMMSTLDAQLCANQHCLLPNPPVGDRTRSGAAQW